MTEQNRDEMLKDIKDGYIDVWDNMAIDELFETIEKEHVEIQQYKAIGTVEGYERAIQSSIENYNLYREYKAKVQEFESIGTVEELQALKEKSVAKKPIEKIYCGGLIYGGKCPTCQAHINSNSHWKYCKCGQHIDWK